MSRQTPTGTLQQAYEHAVTLIRQNQPDLAEVQLREILRSFPKDVNTGRMLGVTLVLQGKFKEAIEQLEAVIKAAPKFAAAYDDLGGALVEASRLAEAEKVLRKAVTLDPKLTNAWRRLGDLLASLDRGREADEAYEHVLASNPIRRLMAEAKDHLGKEETQKAETKLKELLKRDPRNSEAYGLLATISLKAGAFRDAERLLKHTRKQDEAGFDRWGLLGHVLKLRDKLEESGDVLKLGLSKAPNDPRLWSTLGATHAQALESQEALKAFNKSLALAPNQPQVHISIGNVQSTLGNTDTAIENFKNGLKDKDQRGEAYWSLSNLKTYEFTDAEIEDMNMTIASLRPRDSGFVPLNYALGKAAEDREDYDAAFEYYAAGAAQRSSHDNYKPEVIEKETDRMISFFTKDFFEERKGWGCEDSAPIFVLGLPRSGSTLQEQILASHSQIDGTMELHNILVISQELDDFNDGEDQYPEILTDVSADTLESYGERFIEETMKYRKGAPFFIDKMPNNFRHVGLIHLILPNATIIDARRHPMDACFAGFKQHFALGQSFSYDLEHIARFYVNYVRLMDHWESVLPGKILRVQYEDVIEDTEAQVKRTLDHCNLPFEEECLRFYETKRAVRTPSAEQVRQPIYSKGVGYWRHFEKHLDPLKKALEPLADRYPIG